MEQGYYDDTLVWFTTDNGPEGNCYPDGFCGDGFYGSWPGSAGPLRGRKRDLWEGGHRVPGIVSWPNVVKGPARESWDFVITSDFLATVMDVLGVDRPAQQQDWALDGKSILPLLKGEEWPERGLGWLMGFQHGWPPKDKAFRFGNWKYVNGSKGCTTPSCHTEQLFDLSVDLGEKNDISADHPQILADIRANFSEWYASVAKSRASEAMCGQKPTPTPPPAPPSDECAWVVDTGVTGNDVGRFTLESKEACCGKCKMTPGCAASVFNGGACHLKASYVPAGNRTGSIACIPTRPASSCSWVQDTGISGGDFRKVAVESKEHCCGLCRDTLECVAADFNGGQCHLKTEYSPVGGRAGSIACLPNDARLV